MKLWRDLDHSEEIRVGDREFQSGPGVVSYRTLKLSDLRFINRKDCVYQREVKLQWKTECKS